MTIPAQRDDERPPLTAQQQVALQAVNLRLALELADAALALGHPRSEARRWLAQALAPARAHPPRAGRVYNRSGTRPTPDLVTPDWRYCTPSALADYCRWRALTA